jgi:hypothetical protein
MSIRMTLIFMSQTIQRLADSWRSIFGSTAISVVQSFCDSREDLRDSDEARQEFASHYIENSRFSFKDTSNKDHLVRKSVIPYVMLLTIACAMPFRNGRGSSVAPWSFKPSLHTSWLSRVPKRFLASIFPSCHFRDLLVR